MRDRTFFFGAYQGLIEANGLGDEQNPVYPLLTADRSAAGLGAQFCPAGHLDSHGNPAAGYLTLAGGAQVACDGSNINPVALAILNAKLPNGQLAVPSPQVPIPSNDLDSVTARAVDICDSGSLPGRPVHGRYRSNVEQ